MFIQTGSCDFCLEASLKCARKASAEGVDVALHSWEFMPHVFFLLHGIPEAEAGSGIGSISEKSAGIKECSGYGPPH